MINFIKKIKMLEISKINYLIQIHLKKCFNKKIPLGTSFNTETYHLTAQYISNVTIASNRKNHE